MVIHAPAVRKHLSADALLGMLRSGFADLAEHRSGNPRHCVDGCAHVRLCLVFAQIALAAGL